MIVVYGPALECGHGQAVAHSFASRQIAAGGLPSRYIDAVRPADGALGTLRSRLGGLARLRHAIREAPARVTCYLTISSGLGLLTDIVVLLMCRMHRCSIVVHHHSAAVARDGRLVRVLNRCGATHVVLADGMRSDLPDGSKSLVVTNAACVDADRASDAPADREGSEREAIGFLGRVESVKGADTLVALAELGVSVEVAGPAGDDFEVGGEAPERGRLVLHGSVHGAKKWSFLESLDLLLFPSRYRIEAQPLVLYEAWASGVRVVSSDVGYIGEQIANHPAAVLVPSGSSAEEWRAALERCPTTVARTEIRAAFAEEVETSRRQWAALIDFLGETLR